MALRSRLPQDVLSHIFQFDDTYHGEMCYITETREFKYQVWRNWKKQLFACEMFCTDVMFRRKLEFILDYHFDRTMAKEQPFPANITIKCPSKMFYYSNQKQHPHDPAHYLQMFRRGILNKSIEVSFEHNGYPTQKYVGEVFTKEDYYSYFVNVYIDDHDDYHCFYSNSEFYLVEHIDENNDDYY